MSTGSIQSLSDRGFGFVHGDDGSRRFFQASWVKGLPFDQLRKGMRCTYKPGEHAKGLRALNVQIVSTDVEKVAA